MLFNSFEFLLFFCVVFLIYYILPHRFRWFLLLAASYFFYGFWEWRYLGIIFVSTIIDYFAGIQIHDSKSAIKKRLFLYISLFSNLSILVVFKYYNFFIENINEIVGSSISYLDFLLPVGISFYTFQTMSYSIDLYNGKLDQPERHFGIFALFVTFFPQLVAGPIERASQLLPQFKEKIRFNYDRIATGLSLILWGLFKKVVIADRLAILADEVFNNVQDYHGATFMLATLFFAFQIYCDFSGYSDMAIGTARAFGFDLNLNFNKPYLATSLREFWQRWHISLSTWFRDYVYIPIGGKRTVKWRWYYNLLITFVISGLWHGANWTFLIWGAIHGVVLILEYQFNFMLNKPIKTNLVKLISIISTFFIVCLAWIFFRSNQFSDAQYVYKELFNVKNYSLNQLGLNVVDLAKDTVYPIDIALGFLLIPFLMISEIVFTERNFFTLPKMTRAAIYLIGIIIVLLLGIFNNTAFIYFQF
jgi:alginate O-acetyltransferase complex protein AlgI